MKMTARHCRIVGILVLIALLEGCGRGPDLEAIAAAAYEQSRPHGCTVQVGRARIFGYPQSIASINAEHLRHETQGLLVELGLVEALPGRATWMNREYPGVTYSLTELGQRYAHGDRMCFAELRLKGLRDISASYQIMGRTYIDARGRVEVRLSEAAMDPRFRRNLAVSPGNTSLQEMIDAVNRGEPMEVTFSFLETDDGWTVSCSGFACP